MTLAPYYILISNLLMVTAQVKTKQAIETINTTQPVAPQTTEPPLVVVSVYVVLLGNIKLLMLMTPSAGAKD